MNARKMQLWVEAGVVQTWLDLSRGEAAALEL